MQVLPRLFKLITWVDLDTFYAKVKFGEIGFCMGKSENYLFFSSPEPKVPGGAYSIGRLRSPSVVRPSVRPSTISKDFSSETTGPIVTKFHIQPPGTLEKKNCSNGLGNMTSMAAMPIYVKNLKKSSSPEPIDQ